MKHKFRPMWKLFRSDMYILITNKESIIHADIAETDKEFLLSILEATQAIFDKAVEDISKEFRKGKANGRKSNGRSKSSPNK